MTDAARCDQWSRAFIVRLVTPVNHCDALHIVIPGDHQDIETPRIASCCYRMCNRDTLCQECAAVYGAFIEVVLFYVMPGRYFCLSKSIHGIR